MALVNSSPNLIALPEPDPLTITLTPNSTSTLPCQQQDFHASPVQPALRRSLRQRMFPSHLEDYVASCDLTNSSVCMVETITSSPNEENLRFEDVSTDPNWQSAMQAEYNALMANQTWTLTPLPTGQKAIIARWIYRTKPGPNGIGIRYKARLVARGFQQRAGVDYTETFAPVVKWETIRLIVGLSAHRGWPIQHLDVQTAFLHGILTEPLYLMQPQGFISPGQHHLVYRLQRALYGLCQSPQLWYSRIHTYLLSLGLQQSTADPNLYFKTTRSNLVLTLLYVDDLLITGDDPLAISQLQSQLTAEFTMTDLGSVTRYLGVQFQQTRHGLLLHQHDFAMNILLLAQMLDCRPTFVPMAEGTILRRSMNAPTVNAQLYRQLVGKLLYLTRTRPDLAFFVGVASHYMQVPEEPHLELVRSILRYLWRYPSIGFYFVAGEDNHMQGSSDVDYAQDADDRISVGA
jgi:hypothetical protein